MIGGKIEISTTAMNPLYEKLKKEITVEPIKDLKSESINKLKMDIDVLDENIFKKPIKSKYSSLLFEIIIITKENKSIITSYNPDILKIIKLIESFESLLDIVKSNDNFKIETIESENLETGEIKKIKYVSDANDNHVYMNDFVQHDLIEKYVKILELISRYGNIFLSNY